MPRAAWAFFWLIVLIGLALGASALINIYTQPVDWLRFIVLTGFASVSQFIRTLSEGRRGHAAGAIAHSPVLVFFAAGVFLLPPHFFVLLVLIPHVVEWAREYWSRRGARPAWHVQPFNIASHIVVGLVAQQIFVFLSSRMVLVPTHVPLGAAAVAILLYLGLNHLVLGQMLVLARKLSWSETRLWGADMLVSDGIMLTVGYVFALLWHLHPVLSLPSLAPLVLVQQALMVPQLKVQASTDGKTGLYNASHFDVLFSAELKRAQRFGRPLALLVADLDLLRNVNNTYGHLAGDAVLRGIGEIIRDTIREYDIAARFGGEEFVVAMPESGMEEASIVAERIRSKVEATHFRAETVNVPLRVTISIGIACFPKQAAGATELVHQADLAVYRAKLEGRNRVVCADDTVNALRLPSTSGPVPSPSLFHDL